MKKIPFEKYQGLGNDFVLFDLNLHPDTPEPDTEAIKRICHRRLSVGANGVLLFSLASENHADGQPMNIQMVYFNADGSRAETCFNGIRCMALHAVLSGVVTRKTSFNIITDGGNIVVSVDENLNLVKMETFQLPRFEPSEVPVSSSNRIIDQLVEFEGFSLKGTALSVGNPHFVVWVDLDDLDKLNDEVLRLGPAVENAGIFPEGVNFELASQLSYDKLLMAVWERGAGRTLACGSGAVATVFAGIATGRCKDGQPIEVIMAGGKLVVTIPKLTGQANVKPIIIEGPAEHVFSGSFSL